MLTPLICNTPYLRNVALLAGQALLCSLSLHVFPCAGPAARQAQEASWQRAAMPCYAELLQWVTKAEEERGREKELRLETAMKEVKSSHTLLADILGKTGRKRGRPRDLVHSQ